MNIQFLLIIHLSGIHINHQVLKKFYLHPKMLLGPRNYLKNFGTQIVGLGHILWNLQVVIYYTMNMGFKLHKFQTNMLWVSILLEISKVWTLCNCPWDATFKEGTGLTVLCSLENKSSMKPMIGVLTKPLWNIFACLEFHIMTHTLCLSIDL